MSYQLIDRYYNKLQKIIQYGGSENEMSIRDAFKELLSHYAEKKNLMLITELRIIGTKDEYVQPDGTLKNALRLDYGHWESKDSKDNIDAQIDAKIKTGYPLKNILFEDSKTAVLFQHGDVVERADMKDRDLLDKILNQFVSYEPAEIFEFNKALEQFKDDLPHILDALRELLKKEAKENKEYIKAKEDFLENCRLEINPEFTNDDVREIVIQHILTEEIFNAIFDESHFHMENNIARKVDTLIKTFFTGDKRRNTLDSIKHYYNVISAAAKNIVDHHEKQKFLKVIYENFYKSYNPKAADRLGVVYTPNEIVKFMIESTDYLLDKHFGKTLSDKNVEILDPATGTGTFICELIEHIPADKLKYKYKNEIHANEVAILPYYVANLNIEYTFKQKMNYYSEFPNLCFVDTLDNTGALSYAGKQELLFGLSSENAERIKKQNEKKISVVIGNPPYNANQLNENENNKNREYPDIDKRIKNTYIFESTAQKTKLYDMYTRFLRWASDRVDKNGIVAFVSNSSFIDSRTYDGFRKLVAKDFNEIWIIDFKGNARTSGERRRKEGGNVFDDQIRVGVAVYFLVKNQKKDGCKIFYNSIDDYVKSKEKREYLSINKINNIQFKEVEPDKNHNWINLTDNDYELNIALASKHLKKHQEAKTLFNHYSNGIITARDEWVYDFSELNLAEKIKYFVKEYNHTLKSWQKYFSKNSELSKFNSNKLLLESNRFVYEQKPTIKWSSRLRRDKLIKDKKATYFANKIVPALYRPFFKQYLYNEYILLDIVGKINNFVKIDEADNPIIFTSGIPHHKHFQCLASNLYYDFGALETTHGFALNVFDEKGNKHENITDWGLKQFQSQYKNLIISKEDIFHYVYGVLHNPAYRKKYEQNLKREFPRIPFYKNFTKWAKWGKELMELHINYEDAEPYKFLRKDELPKNKKAEQKKFLPKVKEPEVMFKHQPKIKVKLKADKENGKIFIDEVTTLSRIPKLAWEYKLGNRTAIEWVLEYHKERKPKDPTIREKFNNYRFADYKEEVIELIRKVCTVSIKTMEIVNKMEKEKD